MLVHGIHMVRPDLEIRLDMLIQPSCLDLTLAESGSRNTSGSVSLGAAAGTTDLPETTQNSLFIG